MGRLALKRHDSAHSTGPGYLSRVIFRHGCAVSRKPGFSSDPEVGQPADAADLASTDMSAEVPAGAAQVPVEPASQDPVFEAELRDLRDRRLRLAAEADIQADRVRAALAADRTQLARFEDLLVDARQIGHLTETHNYWIDRMAQASLRTFVVRVGQVLADAGLIEQPHDIFHLHRHEVPDVLSGGDDRRAVIAARKHDLDRFASLRPPRRVGKPADDVGGDRFDGARIASSAADELRGTGASAGVARGTARVTLTQADFEAVRPGDIIVCPSSNPSWVPLFAIAGGLITNTGGVLCHAAVVAREFALPAVVGTGDATSRIADGRLVELDGSTGIVRLL
jgi:pyruvate,water dikinase